MIRCASCGSMVSENSISCPYCGKPLPAVTGRFTQEYRPRRGVANDWERVLFEREVRDELEQARLQRTVILILLSGGLILHALTLVVLLT